MILAVNNIVLQLGILLGFIAVLIIFARVMKARNKKKKKRNRHY